MAIDAHPIRLFRPQAKRGADELLEHCDQVLALSTRSSVVSNNLDWWKN